MKRRTITENSAGQSILILITCSAIMFGIAGWKVGLPHLMGLVTGAWLMFLNARKQA